MRLLIRMGLAFLFVAHLSLIGLAQSGIITTYAGPALPVNGALATSQAIDGPESVTADGAGGFYVACTYLNKVFRITVNGKISLLAGTGTPGFSGDGGQATSARLNSPIGVTLDTAGNLFIADSANNRIRKVTPGGVISTVAGNGTAGFSGDGGQATSARLNNPMAVAVDTGGNLFIADAQNNRIRKVTPGGMINTVAGNGGAGFSGDGGWAISASLNLPESVAVDAAGNLFIADSANDRIRKVMSGGVIGTVAGNGTRGFGGDGGLATSAAFAVPVDVAVDTAGNLFIADSANNRIRKVTPGGMISTVAGGGSSGLGDGGQATSAWINNPLGVAVDTAGNLFIADSANNRVRKVTAGGVISTMAGNGTVGFSGDGGQATAAQLYWPRGLAVDTMGNLFIADSTNNRVRKVTPGGIISTVAGNGIAGFSGDGGQATSAKLNDPDGLAVDTAGNLFIADSTNNRVRKVTPGGIISTAAGGGTSGLGDGGQATSAWINNPSAVALDTAGNLFIADTKNNRIRKVTSGGVISTVAGNGIAGFSGDGGQATSARISGPWGLAVDGVGNLFIVDSGNARVRKVTPGGVISTVAGNGIAGYGGDGGPATSAKVDTPTGIAVDGVGNLFIADQMNQRVRKVTPGGVISTVAGNGTAGFSGDGGPAASAQLHYPVDVAMDAAANLFITDSENSRVRKAALLVVSTNLTLSTGGSATASTAGLNGPTQTGYGIATVNTGSVPYGTAVFSFKQNGVTVTEAGVPASPPTTSARVFIDFRSGVLALPGQSNSGVIDINTGIAVVNTGAATASVTYTLRDTAGTTLAIGNGTIAAGAHFAKFISQLTDVAPNLNLPPNFQNTTQFGSLDIDSDQPLSVMALRGTNNQRNDFLITTTPIADLTQSVSYAPVYFPQFADGGGYTTTLVLLNTTNRTENGTLQILDSNGSPLVVNQVGGTADSSFRYSIPPGGAFHLQTDGSPSGLNVGWVQLTPDLYSPTPVGSGVFSYNPGPMLISESGIPSAVSTTRARVYVDLSGDHNTGLAIANVGSAAASITINAFQNDGVTPAGTSRGPLQLTAYGHDAEFADQFITGLPAGFTGVLDINSATPFAALTMRSLVNERDDFLMATFPIADANAPAPSPIVFPQVADGGGYVTQFIFISPTGASSATLSFYGDDGTPLAIGE